MRKVNCSVKTDERCYFYGLRFQLPVCQVALSNSMYYEIPPLHHFQLVSPSSHFVLCPSFPICKVDWPWQLIQADAVRLISPPPPPTHWWTWQGQKKTTPHQTLCHLAQHCWTHSFPRCSFFTLTAGLTSSTRLINVGNSIGRDRIRFGGGVLTIFWGLVCPSCQAVPTMCVKQEMISHSRQSPEFERKVICNEEMSQRCVWLECRKQEGWLSV